MTTPAVTLRTITPSNFDAVISLRVADDQASFVASNVYSLAEAYVESEYFPFAIYTGDEPVGFTMFAHVDDTGDWWVMRLMIAQSHQGIGYGRRAMEILIPLMIERHGMQQIVTSYEPGNEAAASLYRTLGFVDTGEMGEGEHLMRLSILTWNERT